MAINLNKPLQNFTLLGKPVTSRRPLSKKEREMLMDIFSRAPLTRDEYLALSASEKNPYQRSLELSSNILTLDAQDAALQFLTFATSENATGQIYDRNQLLITEAIYQYVSVQKKFPTVTEIGRITALSRPTVYRHLAEYLKSTDYQQKQASFALMRERILTGLYQKAAEGDLRAAEIFLKSTDTGLPETGKSNTITIVVDVEKNLNHLTH